MAACLFADACPSSTLRFLCLQRPTAVLSGNAELPTRQAAIHARSVCAALPARSSYTPAFLAASALCFPGGFNKTGLLDDIKFKVCLRLRRCG